MPCQLEKNFSIHHLPFQAILPQLRGCQRWWWLPCAGLIGDCTRNTRFCHLWQSFREKAGSFSSWRRLSSGMCCAVWWKFTDVSEVLTEFLFTLMMEEASTLVNFYPTTQRNVPKDTHLHTCVTMRTWNLTRTYFVHHTLSKACAAFLSLVLPVLC
jgi:hypothetical protein